MQSANLGSFVTVQTGFAGGYKWLLTATSSNINDSNNTLYGFPGC